MSGQMDDTTTVAELRALVRQFVDRRNWQVFHAPKNLSMALAVEAAELMEHFQWISVDDSRRVGEDASALEAISDELADIVCYALALTNELGIDFTASFRRKMIKNEAKYPADEYRGRRQKKPPE